MELAKYDGKFLLFLSNAGRDTKPSGRDTTVRPTDMSTICLFILRHSLHFRFLSPSCAVAVDATEGKKISEDEGSEPPHPEVKEGNNDPHPEVKEDIAEA